MSGGRVLLAWELGDGHGHISRLLPLARRLKAAGAECVFAVRDLTNAQTLLDTSGFRFVQAPYASPRSIYSGRLQIGTFGDILETIGYNQADRLAGLVHGWSGLFDIFRPDLVIADYAPTALLAALGRVQSVAIGDWFTLPPSRLERFSDLRKTSARVSENEMLDVVKTVQRARGASEPEYLPGILTTERDFVITLPELDIYAEHRPEPAVGPMAPLPEPVYHFEAEQDFFAYLSATYAGTPKVLEAILAKGLTGTIYLRDASETAIKEWRARGLDIHDRPQNLKEMAQKSRVFVHHGGLGTMETAMALGRPQLCVSRHLEQAVNARLAGRQGLAVGLETGGRFSAADAAQAFEFLMSESSFDANATRVADQLAERGPFNALEPIIEFCLSKL